MEEEHQKNEELVYTVHGSYIEIYNEELKDLLVKQNPRKLKLWDNAPGGPDVLDLLKPQLKNKQEAMKIYRQGTFASWFFNPVFRD